jgi:hypothetical protein
MTAVIVSAAGCGLRHRAGMRGLLAGSAVFLLALTLACHAAEPSVTSTTRTSENSDKASETSDYDWAGAYIGAQLGYAAGNWSSTDVEAIFGASRAGICASVAFCAQRHAGEQITGNPDGLGRT